MSAKIQWASSKSSWTCGIFLFIIINQTHYDLFWLFYRYQYIYYVLCKLYPLSKPLLKFFLVIRHTKIFLSDNLEYKHCDSTSLSEIITIISIVKLSFLSHWKITVFLCHLYNNTNIYSYILLACIFTIFVILQFSKQIILLNRKWRFYFCYLIILSC